MSRFLSGTLTALARGRARAERAPALRAQRLRIAERRRYRRRCARLRRASAERRRRASRMRTCATRAELHPDVRAAYRAAPPEVRRLILEQHRDDAARRVKWTPAVTDNTRRRA